MAIAAGNFSEWLRSTEASLRSGKGEADVPCGSCNACCRSSMFIHIQPDESPSIPRALLFPAPGLPKGQLVMGYNDKGACPMLVESKCSVYEDRPQTCRSYDCRVLAAAGIALDERTQAEVAERVRAWEFTFESDAGREELRMVRAAAAFLQANRNLFPKGSLPSHPAPLAALAIRVCRLFDGGRSQGELVRAIAEQFQK
jgi:uncharacterized protein